MVIRIARRPRAQRDPDAAVTSQSRSPLTVADLGAIDLKPTAIAALLGDAIAAGRDLFKLPDCVHYQLHHVSRVVHELLVHDGSRPASRRMVVN